MTKRLIQIHHPRTGEVIHQGEFSSILECQTDGVKQGKNFTGALVNGMTLGTAIEREEGEAVPAFLTVMEYVKKGGR
jgi:hypothetical protein